jgi:2,4-dienoyl-CoA reductase-like NADH-dependent reductase (Old Yellow Enzyme family)
MQFSEQHPAFTSFTLKGRAIKNRFTVAPMSRVSANEKGVPTHTMQTYYEALAAGGFGMIITEGTYPDDQYSQGYPLQPGMVNTEQVAAWKKIVDVVKKHDVVFINQLMHAGALSQHLSITKAPFAIQPLRKKMPEYGGGEGPFPMPQQMTKQEIEQVVESFAQSAYHAWQAGFDGVEIHAANGYLLDQFLTDYTNQRKDEYGGSIENRFRIISGIINAMRAILPYDFIIGLRLSEGKVNDLYYRWPDGPVTAGLILKEVKKALPDYIHIAAESGNWQRDCTYDDGSSFSGLAKSITGLPVIANGGLHDAVMSRQVLETAQADLLAIGKVALADPNWPAKIKKGQPVIPFMPALIKPSASIKHTNFMRSKPLTEELS